MKSDKEIKNDVLAELEWDSSIDSTKIQAEVKDGHAVLNGTVSAYSQKINAEKAVARVAGIRAISNYLQVNIPDLFKKPDDEIKRSAENVLRESDTLGHNQINVAVKDGWLTLEGRTDWEYQRAKARILAEDIPGVTGVTNLIEVISNTATPGDIDKRIRDAFRRDHYLNNNNNKIEIDVNNGRVILTGQVHTLAEKISAESAAWCAPGVTEVVNELVVDYSSVYA